MRRAELTLTPSSSHAAPCDQTPFFSLNAIGELVSKGRRKKERRKRKNPRSHVHVA